MIDLACLGDNGIDLKEEKIDNYDDVKWEI